MDGDLIVGREEASKRYRAAIAWFDEHKHMVISNGPFMLLSFDPAAQYVELEAFRSSTYPFKPGQWYFGMPTLVEIVEFKGDEVIIGSDNSFTVEVQGKGDLSLKYMLVDPAKAEILKMDEAYQVSPGKFLVTLPSNITADMSPGQYQVVLAAYSSDVSFVAERVEIVNARVPLPTKATSTPTPAPSPTPTPVFSASSIWLVVGVFVVFAAVAAALILRIKLGEEKIKKP
ncbi:MAG: hypothetical protein QXL67_03485 [Candidatus Bathyarchaeia archaeon]